VGRDGLIIESVTRSEIDLDALGAFISTGFGSTEVMGTELSLGYLLQSILEYDIGKILICA